MRTWILGPWVVFALGCRDPPAPAAPPQTAAPLRFSCGEHSCDAGASYCEMIKTDVAALPSTFTCKPLPAACGGGAASCGCFPPGTRCDYCARLERDGVWYFQRTCVGGR